MDEFLSVKSTKKAREYGRVFKGHIEFPYGNDICYRVLFSLSGDILEMFIRGLYSVGE